MKIQKELRNMLFAFFFLILIFEICILHLTEQSEVQLPITKSAKKALASSERKRAHNITLENKLKKALKKVDAKNSNETISLIDKMAKIHLIRKNKAARLKSRISKKYGTPKAEKKAVVAPKKTVAKKPVAKKATPIKQKTVKKTEKGK